jgi:hypothetical protein
MKCRMKALLILLQTAFVCGAVQLTGSGGLSGNGSLSVWVQGDIEFFAYLDAVTGAGGTLSASESNAVRNFCHAAFAHGYWDQLLDVAPMAGETTNAAG